VEHRQIRELRGSLGLSQERFAQFLGVSLQTVRRWESGLTKPLPIISLKLEELHRETTSQRRRVGGIPRAGGIPMTGARRGIEPDLGRQRGEASVELGLGGLFKGIGSLLDLVSRMVEEGKEGTTRTGEIEGLGGNLRGVYGFSLRMGLEGKPVIEQFGNIHETEAGTVVTETREPLVDVLDEGDHLAVIAELPGVEEQDIHIEIEGDILEITAESKDRKYQKDVLLPSSVDRRSLKSSFRNGILEIRLVKERPV